MKRNTNIAYWRLSILLGIFMMLSTAVFAQTNYMVSYLYDASGNRISRTCQPLGMNSLKMEDDSTAFTAEDIEKTIKENKRYESEDGEVRFTLYPNPTKGRMLLKIEPFEERYVGSELSLLDMSGKILSTVIVKENISIIDLRGYNKGNYVLVLDDKTKKRNWQIVKY